MSFLLMLPCLLFSLVALVACLATVGRFFGSDALGSWIKVRLKSYEGGYWTPMEIIMLMPVAWIVAMLFGLGFAVFAELVRYCAPTLITVTGWALILRACSLATVIFWAIIYLAERHRKQQPRS